MALDDADPAVYAFQSLGVINLLTTDFVVGTLPSILAPIESFLCKVYAPKNSNITNHDSKFNVGVVPPEEF